MRSKTLIPSVLIIAVLVSSGCTTQLEQLSKTSCQTNYISAGSDYVKNVFFMKKEEACKKACFDGYKVSSYKLLGDDCSCDVNDCGSVIVSYCPESCNDGNDCTKDYCSSNTSYRCEHEAIIPCCGDNRCTMGETCESCAIDCGKCDYCPTTTLTLTRAFYKTPSLSSSYTGSTTEIYLYYKISTQLSGYNFDTEIIMTNDEAKHPNIVVKNDDDWFVYYEHKLVISLEGFSKEDIKEIKVSLSECPNVVESILTKDIVGW